MKKHPAILLVIVGILVFACSVLTVAQEKGMLTSLDEIGDERDEKIPDQVQATLPQIHSPIRIAYDKVGDLFVTDQIAGGILILDKNTLNVKRFIDIKGKPLAVASVKNAVVVGNVTKKSLDVYNRWGKYFGSYGTGTIGQPMDIAIDKDSRRVFVVDGSIKAVRIYNFKGTPITTFPAGAPNANILTNPTGIAVDKVRKEVLVSDYGDDLLGIRARIQIFNYSGELVDTISNKLGMMGSKFSRPQGLAADGNGHIFMVDCFSGEILVFDRVTKVTLKIMAGYGTEPGKLRLPYDLIIHPETNDIFVTNNRLARIEQFVEGGVL